MKKTSSLLLMILMLSIGCSKQDTSIPCDDITDALFENDLDILKAILNPELVQFTFIDADNDFCLHSLNLDAFTYLLNDQCEKLDASIICCACIETYPPVSEIMVELDSSGIQVNRILDLSSPDEGPLSLVSMH